MKKGRCTGLLAPLGTQSTPLCSNLSITLSGELSRGASGEEEKRLKLKSKGISPHFTI